MADVKLFEPQRISDNPDGGGLATTNEIIDGQINNLFSDISRIDRVNGDVSIRKVFVQAATADTSLYSGLHCIIQAPPLDPRVSAVLFETPKWAEVRSGAQAFIERYLDASVITRLIPYDRQLAGQRTVLVFTRPELSLPEIGEVYALENEITDAVEYFRIADLDHEVQTFTDAQGDFQARIITITITQPLSQEFQGIQPSRFFIAGDVVVRKTFLSDAAKYRGVIPLAANAQIGDLTIRLESIFGQLVPSATTEVAILDAPVFAALGLHDSGVARFTHFDLASASTGTYTRYVPTAISPGSVEFSNGIYGGLAVDDGGNIVGTVPNLTKATVDNFRGSFSITSSGGQTYRVNYLPAVSLSAQAITTEAPVEIQNRGYVYTQTLRPVPSPGSVAVQYRALGRWYELTDDGSGRLTGDSGVGSGSINYQSGTVSVTLGALPDIGSSVLYSWGGSTEYEIHAGDLAIAVPGVEAVLSAGNCEPGSLTVTWLAGTTTKTATDNGSGVLSGNAVGTVIYGTGEVFLRPNTLPNQSAAFQFSYLAGTSQSETFTPSKSGGYITLAAGSAPIRPKSIKINYTITFESGVTEIHSKTITDDGAGGLLDESGTTIAGGTVNYSTAVISFNPDFSALANTVVRTNFSATVPGRTLGLISGYYGGQPLAGNYSTGSTQVPQTMVFVNGSTVILNYKLQSATDAAHTETVAAPPLNVDLTPLTTAAIVPDSLLFTLGGKTYYERAGSLYHTMDSRTGAGVLAGSVNLVTGIATITSWTGAVVPSFVVHSLLTQLAPVPTRVIHGRAPGSPLRPSSFQIQANRYRDGALISAIADNNGNIDTAEMHGYVDVTTGVFSVAFGAYVLDSSLTTGQKAEPWYSSAFVDTGGYIFRPDEAMPGTIRFNCVVQTSLPQDPEIIGINPVRLPSDGRVPIMRPGDTLVISDTQAQTLSSGLTAGQVLTLPRTGLGSVALYDQNGLGVSDALYTANLIAGTVTMATPLDLSAYLQPLVALHTIEDMALCIDTQITGEVSLGNPLTHAYSADNALCSSALIVGSAGGDVQARYADLFAQATWTTVWSDTRIGSAPSSGAQYNDVNYPLQVLNRDTITQRWALVFTSSTAFNVVAEELGIIGTGTISADCAPNNPVTGQPYFRLLQAGFGIGWATSNVIRFATVAAGAPIWIARTVRSGPATVSDDRVRIQARWDKD